MVGIYKHLAGNVSREEIKRALLQMLKTFCFAFKHPGFAEEREFRVVYRPSDADSELLGFKDDDPSTDTVILPLGDASPNSFGISSLKAIVHKVLIGPTATPDAAKAKVEESLLNQGVTAPVELSQIPLRT